MENMVASGYKARTKAADTNGHDRVEVDIRVAVLVGGDLVVEVRVEVDLGGVTVLGLIDGNFVGVPGSVPGRVEEDLVDGNMSRGGSWRVTVADTDTRASATTKGA